MKLLNIFQTKYEIDIYIYEPTRTIKEQLKKERVRLTPARALLLYVLFDLVKHGEYVSEFSSEKICYFLQKFGAKKYFNLKFEAAFYGPYSGKVRYILNRLNGSYIKGYSDMNRKPFDPLMLIPDTFDDVKKFVESDRELNEIAKKTTEFLRGFYSDFSLELLPTIDYIVSETNTYDFKTIKNKLLEWSNRKKSLFTERHIQIALDHLKKQFWHYQ